MKLFTGTSNLALAERIAEYIGVPLGRIDIRRFPDGEISLKVLDNVRGQDVFVIQSTSPSPNESLMELLIMMDALRRASAARITAVLPFYAYARQDRKDQPRVPITAKLVANLLVAAGAHRILAVDLHAQQIQGFFDIPVDHLYSSPVLVKYFQGKGLKDVVVVSPDTGGMKMAHAYANMLNAGLAVVAKQRNGPTEVEALTLVGEVKGCHAILVDDLITTAGTVCAAAKFLKEHGALDVYGAITHAALAPIGIERLRGCAIQELVVTDTICLPDVSNCPITVLSVAELLGEAIIRIHDNQSVSSLFIVKPHGDSPW